MDGLDQFEKTLAAEKADRERLEQRKHRHHHRRHRQHDDDSARTKHGDQDGHKDSSRRHHRRHRDDEEDDGHRSKRSRRSRDDADDAHGRQHRSRHHHRHDKPSDPSPDDEKPPSRDSVDPSKSSAPLVRDAWMTAPSALDVEHIHRPDRSKAQPPTDEPKRVIHHRELNRSLQAPDDDPSSPSQSSQRTVDYTFGDAGSSWRMTKLKTVRATAEETGRLEEDVAIERYGTLEEYDDAREEQAELERRKIYGEGYQEREKPTGDLYRERQRNQQTEEQGSPPDQQPEQGVVIPDETPPPPATDRTALNRLRARMMKAKLRRAPDAAQLEQEYSRAAAALASQAAPEAVVLGVKESRQLAGPRGEVKAMTTRRGRERGAVEENDDMTVDDMVREERRTKGQAGGEGMRLAERIARDARFADNLEYMDDNAARLARRVHKGEVSLKNAAVAEVQRATRALDRCPLCHDEDAGRPPAAPVVALGTRVFLTLATQPEVSEGGAVIAPLAHRANLLECDDDEWEEVRNFMKSLTRMYHDQGRDVVFYENAAHPHRRAHAAMAAVPIPYDQGAVAPAFFREAMLAADEEWSQHPKVIDTLARARDGGLGRAAFRRSLAREMPYFHAWFALDGGLGHVVEDPRRWPRGDLFAREVLASVVGAEPGVARRQGRWVAGADAARVEAWRRAWRRFDWTRALVDEAGGG